MRGVREILEGKEKKLHTERTKRFNKKATGSLGEGYGNKSGLSNTAQGKTDKSKSARGNLIYSSLPDFNGASEYNGLSVKRDANGGYCFGKAGFNGDSKPDAGKKGSSVAKSKKNIKNFK